MGYSYEGVSVRLSLTDFVDVNVQKCLRAAHTVPSSETRRQDPKSASLMWPLASSRMLSGFTSRWTYRSLCIDAMANTWGAKMRKRRCIRKLLRVGQGTGFYRRFKPVFFQRKFEKKGISFFFKSEKKYQISIIGKIHGSFEFLNIYFILIFFFFNNLWYIHHPLFKKL